MVNKLKLMIRVFPFHMNLSSHTPGHIMSQRPQICSLLMNTHYLSICKAMEIVSLHNLLYLCVNVSLVTSCLVVDSTGSLATS